MDPAGFYEVAELLGSDGEARQRSAVSRLYYGVHHEFVQAYGLVPPRRARHQWVRERLAEGTSERPSLSPTALRWMRSLEARRSQADYDLSDPWSQAYLSEARELVARIRSEAGFP